MVLVIWMAAIQPKINEKDEKHSIYKKAKIYDSYDFYTETKKFTWGDKQQLNFSMYKIGEIGIWVNSFSPCPQE